jgi:predicted transcriptional regulator
MSTSILIPDDLQQTLQRYAHADQSSLSETVQRFLREAIAATDQKAAEAIQQRLTAAALLLGMGKHWSPERNAQAELIAERESDPR